MAENSKKSYSIVVETLKAMYLNKDIDISKAKSMLNKEIITDDEYNYITGRI